VIDSFARHALSLRVTLCIVVRGCCALMRTNDWRLSKGGVLHLGSLKFSDSDKYQQIVLSPCVLAFCHLYLASPGLLAIDCYGCFAMRRVNDRHTLASVAVLADPLQRAMDDFYPITVLIEELKNEETQVCLRPPRAPLVEVNLPYSSLICVFVLNHCRSTVADALELDQASVDHLSCTRRGAHPH
jgi:hypothetical protein